jgi:uncharacterized protein YukE
VAGGLTCALVGAYCGNAFTVMAKVDTGDPPRIIAHAADLTQRAANLATLRAQLGEMPARFDKVWTGQKSNRVKETFAELDKHFAGIIEVLGQLSKMLNSTAQKVATARQGFAAGIAKGHAAIRAVLASGQPGAQAARGIASGTTGSLQQFISGIGQALSAMGATQLGSALQSIGQLLGQMEQVTNAFTGGGSGSQSPSGSPTTLPASLQPSTLPASQQPSTLPATLPSTLPQYTNNYQPSALDKGYDMSWIPVNGGAAQSGGGVEVTVTTKDGSSSVVTAPLGRDTSVDVVVGGEKVRVEIDGDGDGRVTAT